MNYKSNNPYPKPMVERQNLKYAEILLEDYAGNISEDTAIHFYLYNYFITNNELQEFADTLNQIAKVEMIHLRLLGETIKLLGLNPIYGTLTNNNIFKPWISLNIDYNTNLKIMIEEDIKSEQLAIQNYKYHLSIINDKYIKELISRIIEDEKIHLNIFKYFYKKYFQ